MQHEIMLSFACLCKTRKSYFLYSSLEILAGDGMGSCYNILFFCYGYKLQKFIGKTRFLVLVGPSVLCSYSIYILFVLHALHLMIYFWNDVLLFSRARHIHTLEIKNCYLKQKSVLWCYKNNNIFNKTLIGNPHRIFWMRCTQTWQKRIKIEKRPLVLR